MLIPAIRAMCFLYSLVVEGPDQPWRCLWRGSVQITRTTPLRRMTLQLRHIFLTDAATFMSLFLSFRSLRPEHYPCPAQIVRRQFDGHLVAGKDADVVHAHLPGNV